MAASRKGKLNLGLALGVERGSGQGLAAVADGDGAGGRQSIFAGYGDGDSSLGEATLIASLRGKRCLRGQTLRTIRSHCQRGHRQSDTKSCNQLKPQTAADQTSHVHLLQNSNIVVRLFAAAPFATA